jgi:hypothetical protein
MKASEIREAIEIQAQDRKRHLGMPRDALQGIVCEDGFATIVTGVRRSGKSTLLNQWTEARKERVVSVHFDDLRLSAFETSDFAVLDAVVREMGADTLVLDEAQDIPAWERYVAGNLDAGRRVLVTGSNATLLSREFGTKLTGRHLNAELQPFSYAEFLRFTKQSPSPETLSEYLAVGGFPAHVKTRRREILSELFADIIYRDIVVRYRLRDPAPVRSLAAYLLGHVGSLVSPSRLKDAMHIRSAGTILEYFSYLEETYLLRRLPRFASSPKASLSHPKKIYACDTGLVSAMGRNAASNLGHKLENLVFLKLLAPEATLSYYVDAASDAECDFLVERGDGSFAAVQVAWSLTPDNEDREFAGAVRAMERFGLKEATLVTHSQRDLANLDGRLLHIVPAHDFLLQANPLP